MDQNQNQNPPPADRSLICVECNQKFNFSGGEQEFYARQGFQEPKRCKVCRLRREARKQGGHMLVEALVAQALAAALLLLAAWLLGGCGAAEAEGERCRPACAPGYRCVGRVYPVMIGAVVPSAQAVYACEREGGR